MRSSGASGEPPDIKLRSSSIQRLCYTCFYPAESLISGARAWQKWDFAIFWPFFAIWGWIYNPHSPSSSFIPPGLTPTLLVTNSKKVLTTLKKFFSFFFHYFWCKVTPSPIWPNVTPWGPPLRPPPCHITFFTSIQCLCIELHHLVHSEIEFTAQCHPTFSRGHNSGFQPF